MKIQPPAGPPPGTQVEELAPGAKSKEASGTSFANKLREAGGVDPAASTQAAQSGAAAQKAGMAAHLEAVAADLKTGAISTRDQAVGRLVDRVLDEQFGGQLPADTMVKMKGAVAAQIAADPHLSERIDGLLRKAQSE